MAILDEIRRRNVHKVAIGYLAGAWLLIQIIETLFPMFGVPDPVARGFVIVTGVGFLPAVILSWVFEWTPEGLVRDEELSAKAPRSGTKSLDRAITITLVLAVAYFAVDKFVIDPARDAADIEAATELAVSNATINLYGHNSIAVLPFVNMSSDPEQEYFSDGISEELLNLLARIPELRVISRSTAFSFKGKDVSIPEAAAKMNVAHILEGSVRKAGDQIRVTVQLIHATTDTHLWSATYDRSLDDVFAVQDEISAAIISQLRLKLLDDPPKADEIDPKAYALYLQGREIVHKRREDRYDLARQKLEAVLVIEPDFVPAMWELARILNEGVDPERFDELVERMVEVAPDSSYANGWLAMLAETEEQDFQKAAVYLERAIADDSDWNGAFQLGVGARFMATLGRYEEASEILNYLLSRDPACDWCIMSMAYAMRSAGRQLEAAQRLESIFDWYDPSSDLYWYIGVAWLVAGDAEKALSYFSERTQPPGENLGRILALYSLGRLDNFESEFAMLLSHPDKSPEPIARVYAWTEQNDLAFAWLDKVAEKHGSAYIATVKTDLYSKLYSDSRWLPFLEKHGQTDQDLSNIEFDPILPAAVQKAIADKGIGLK